MTRSKAKNRRLYFSCFLVGIFFAIPAFAAESQTNGKGEEKQFTERGYTADQLYFGIGGAEVNAFSFNMVISLTEQVGYGLPVDGGLSISLNRVYNSNVYSNKSGFSHSSCASGLPPVFRSTNVSIPRQNPLGLGWQLHLGRIYKADVIYPKDGLDSVASCYGSGGIHQQPVDLTAPGHWTFVSPDGSEHQLIKNAAESLPRKGVYYSQDGSLIKAVEGVGRWTVYLPDGRILVMAHQVDGNPISAAPGFGPAGYCLNDPTVGCSSDGWCPDGFCSETTPCWSEDDCPGTPVCQGEPTCNTCTNGITPCGDDSDCPQGTCVSADPAYKGNPCASHSECGEDGFCGLIPTCAGGCSNSTDSCDTTADCPSGLCSDMGACRADNDCNSNDCANPPSCLPQDQNIEPEQPAAPPYFYDRDKIGFHTTQIRGREEDAQGAATAYIDVEYHAAPFDYIIKRVTDSHSVAAGPGVREIATTINDSDSTVASYGKITQISYPAPGGGTTDFDFFYDRVLIGKEATNLNVDVLTRVETPDGYATTYRYVEKGSPDIVAIPGGVGTTDGTEDLGGRLIEIIYPSGKLVQLTYGAHVRLWAETAIDVAQTSGDPGLCGCVRNQHENFVIGLVEKNEFLDGNPGNLDSKNVRNWTFSAGSGPGSFVSHPGFEQCEPTVTCAKKSYSVDSWSEMTDPAGIVRRIDYITSGHDPVADTWPEDKATFGQARKEWYFDANGQDVKWVERTWYTHYHDNDYGISWVEQNSETTTYKDHPDEPQLIIEGSDWNEYRYETTKSYGDAIGDWARFQRTDYAIDNGACQSEAYDDWFPQLAISSKSTVSVNGGAEVAQELTQYAFDPVTGRVTDTITRVDPAATLDPCSQSLTDIGPAADDVVSSVTHDAVGNIVRQDVHFGAAGSTVHTTHFGYDYGVMTSERREGLGYYDTLIDAGAVDPGTSIVLREKYGATYPVLAGDDRFVERETDYDTLWRPISEQIGSIESVHYEYVNATDTYSQDRSRLAEIRTYQGSGDDLRETKEYYDLAGRAYKKEKLNPDGNRAYQHTEFDDAGRVRFVTEWVADASCPGNDCETSRPGTLTDYTVDGDGDPDTGGSDPFGRPRRVAGSLGETTEYDYTGTNRTVTAYGIAGARGNGDLSESPLRSVTEYLTDGLGRLRAVRSNTILTQGGDPGSPAVEAIYDYDYADRLTQVTLVDAVDLTSEPYEFTHTDPSPQVRTFTYDALGRQTSSSHPESGTTTMTAWTALGSPRIVTDARGTALNHHHETTHDVAGRPVKVERVLDEPGFLEVLSSQADWDPAGGSDWHYSNNCFPGSWWHGNEITCRALTSGQPVGGLVLDDAIGPIPPGSTVQFRYFREVRETSGSPLDILTLSAKGPHGGWKDDDVVYELDSSQISWSQWQWSPPISLDHRTDLAGGSVLLRFDLDPVESNSTPTKGIAISNVIVRKPDRLTLHEITYDEDFGLAGNKSNGAATTVTTYDESTLLPDFVKKLEFVQSEGQLSKETIQIDWDRDGVTTPFEASYVYNPLGHLESQYLPHKPGEAIAREYAYTYRHGALVGVTSSLNGLTETIVPDTPGIPGIEYDLAGSMGAIRYGNGLVTRIERNDAYLPTNIVVEDGSQNVLWQTGTYEYDGARNIKTIGNDLYRYDHAGRLARAQLESTGYGSGLVIDYIYDGYGNMLSRQTRLPAGPTSPEGPEGLHFLRRTYANNRLTDTGFEYDENGNMTAEPVLGLSVGNHEFTFLPENRMTQVRKPDDPKIYQESRYDAEGNRWARFVAGDGGMPLITLRSSIGDVAAEYEQESAPAGLQAKKNYIRGNGKLLAAHSTCGPAPSLSVMSIDGDQGNYYLELRKHDHDTVTADYTVEVTPTPPSALTWLQTDPDLKEFDITDWPEGDYLIRLKGTLECGDTGYGNAVSFTRKTASSCITEMALSNTDIDSSTSTINVIGYGENCPPMGFQWRYSLLYYPDVGPPATLADEPKPSRNLINAPAGAGHGRYTWVEYEVATGYSPLPLPMVRNDFNNTEGASGELAGETAWGKTEYFHADHLGSTRLVTNANGVETARYKYYPFGLEAETSSGSDIRLKFTGHERDQELSIDYMKARYSSPNLGRFLSVDPINDVSVLVPQSWNKYSYVRNAPTALVDPSGAAGESPWANELANSAAVRFLSGVSSKLQDAQDEITEVAESIGEGISTAIEETAVEREAIAQEAEFVSDVATVVQLGAVAAAAGQLFVAEPLDAAGAVAVAAAAGTLSSVADGVAALFSPTAERLRDVTLDASRGGLAGTLNRARRAAAAGSDAVDAVLDAATDAAVSGGVENLNEDDE